MAATGVTGAVALCLVWTLSQFGVEMPETVAAAFVLAAAWVAGYVKTELRGTGKRVAE